MIRLFLAFLLLQPLFAQAAPNIVTSSNPSAEESLAAREVRRYIYLRTGELLTIRTSGGRADGPAFWCAEGPDRNQRSFARRRSEGAAAALKPQEYFRKKTGPVSAVIVGGDNIGVLYGAYAFAEHLGVRFYLHGDVVPDGKIPLSIPELNETGKPLFALRGILPFHDFPEGPDWWNTDDYLVCISQLAKNELLKKQRQREIDDYDYRKSLERKKAQDKYDEEVKLQERANKEKQETLEKSWREREATLKAAEEELKGLRKEAAEFPARLQRESEKAAAEATRVSEQKFEQSMLLLTKDSEGEKRMAELRIKALEENLTRQSAQMAALEKQLEEAKRQVQEIAVKAIEGASGARALTHINEIAMEQAKHRPPQG